MFMIWQRISIVKSVCSFPLFLFRLLTVKLHAPNYASKLWNLSRLFRRRSTSNQNKMICLKNLTQSQICRQLQFTSSCKIQPKLKLLSIFICYTHLVLENILMKLNCNTILRIYLDFETEQIYRSRNRWENVGTGSFKTSWKNSTHFRISRHLYQTVGLKKLNSAKLSPEN